MGRPRIYEDASARAKAFRAARCRINLVLEPEVVTKLDQLMEHPRYQDATSRTDFIRRMINLTYEVRIANPQRQLPSEGAA